MRGPGRQAAWRERAGDLPAAAAPERHERRQCQTSAPVGAGRRQAAASVAARDLAIEAMREVGAPDLPMPPRWPCFSKNRLLGQVQASLLNGMLLE